MSILLKGATIVDNKSNLNFKIKDILIKDGVIVDIADNIKTKSKNIIDAVGQGLWESMVTVRGAHYKPGDLYTVVAKENGFVETNLRIERIVHRLGKDGWNVDLTFSSCSRRLSAAPRDVFMALLGTCAFCA